MTFEKTSLHGRHLRLEPLELSHAEGLKLAVSDGELWNLFVTLVPPIEGVENFIRDAATAWQSGDGLAFAMIDLASQKVVGSTRFMKADLNHQRVEIGYTFLAQSYQKTGINTEAKLLMLRHAFETLQLKRVELLTDYLNSASRNAILRLGAKQEGILRNHMTMPDGRIRDSVLFSIIENEWPGVKQQLEYKLSQPR